MKQFLLRIVVAVLTWAADCVDWIADRTAPAVPTQPSVVQLEPTPTPVKHPRSVYHACVICQELRALPDADWCEACTLQMMFMRDDVRSGVRSDWCPEIAEGALVTVRHDLKMTEIDEEDDHDHAIA